MPLAVDGSVTGSLAGTSSVSGNIASTQSVTGTLTTASGQSGGGVPRGGYTGDLMIKRSNDDFDIEWVAPATSAEQDNTRPITSAAVYTEIGNINALLATI